MSPPGAGVGAGGPSPNPECRPRKEQGLPPGPLATGFFFSFFPSRLLSIIGPSATSRVKEVPPALSGRGRPPARQPPKPGKEMGVGSGNGAQGGSEAAGGREETGRAPVLPASPAGRGPGSRDPSPSPDAPQSPVGKREKTEYKSLTTASSPAPAPPSHFPPATAATAALGMIH